jgi:hypothetical protein
MFAPNYVYTKLDKDGNFLFLLPDKTGDVFVINESQKLNRLGHWTLIRKHIDAKKIVPVAKLLVDENGYARFAYNESANLSYEKELLIEKKSASLLGVDWELPLAAQALKIVNRAIYFLGSEIIKKQLIAMQTEYDAIESEKQKIFA